MTTVDWPDAPTITPEPIVLPDLSPTIDADAALIEQVEAAFEDIRVGVSFGTPVTYTYSAPPIAHVGSIVIVPPSCVSPNPQTAEVVTLDPPPYPGPLKRVIAVLT